MLLQALCIINNHWWIQTGVAVRKRRNWVKIDDIFSRVTSKFDLWLWKTIGHLFYATSSFPHHFVAIGEFKHWSYRPETPNLGQIRRIIEPSELEIWQMTLKNNRTPLLSNIKLCASFHYHMWIQTGVTVWTLLSWVLTSVTLTFNLGP